MKTSNRKVGTTKKLRIYTAALHTLYTVYYISETEKDYAVLREREREREKEEIMAELGSLCV